ncbi:NADP-dependent oxidoreductase [Actinoallomurus purpureus]|uniref:NADP-dependent oxidoreductase n=1 Tax=Actinoallomurus purpureus TaxID=478114 RepID=UPI002092250C|nr:NADP-dependent oxidoreductase [Actinoallomurus purpureus]MCO6008263.1 NADP-dependent oxidoreductase [Actinoallomurus purpureus]
MSTRMRAISQQAFGGPEVLEVVETDRPVPGPQDVLVRVRAAGVNPADWKRRAGIVGRFGEPPFTLGLDLAGTVEAVGDRVERFRLGDQVYGAVLSPSGTYAEYAVAPEQALAPAPPSLDLVHAAALPTAALTAWQPLVRVAGVRAGQRVLVHAAAGGVGHLAVQIAKARGAYVIGTARRDKHAFLRELGADELIDYTATDFTTAVRDVDVVLDPISGEYGPRSLRVLTPDGVLLDVRGTGPDRAETRDLARARGLRHVEFGFTPSGDDLREVTDLVEGGALRVVVDQVLPLEAAAKAHELSETGRVKGKIVLTVG